MNNTLIWAHRGASGYAPENTMIAFEMAADMRADGIELDIQLTKDGEIIVLHDETIDRTSNGKGWVKDYTLEELRRLDFSYKKKYPNAGPMQIPTMREVFELVRPTDMRINIELKTGVVFYPEIEKMILDMTAAYGMQDRVIYSSFNHYSIKRIHGMEPKAMTGLLYSDGFIDMPFYARDLGVSAQHPALSNLQYPDYMENCRAAGLLVNTWTVNKEEHIRRCLKLGVDGIITNYPDRVRMIMREMCGQEV